MTSDTISKKPTLKTSANDKIRCFRKFMMSSARGAAFDAPDAIQRVLQLANTVLAPNSVSSAPSSERPRAALLAARVRDDGLVSAPRLPRRRGRRICSMSCTCTWPSAKNTPANAMTTSKSGAIDSSE